MVKATYGTGSSVMMNVGESPIAAEDVTTSLAWKIGGRVEYVLEGNINYAGAVISWLKDEVKLIDFPAETEDICERAAHDDRLYFVPAFTGLGAPYWNSEAKALLTGITRTTGRNEIIRAGVESIAYQIFDVISAMSDRSGIKIKELRVDGGPTRNSYLMRFQSGILDAKVYVPDLEEFSGIGAAYAAGMGMGIYDSEIFNNENTTIYESELDETQRLAKIDGWSKAVKMCCGSN